MYCSLTGVPGVTLPPQRTFGDFGCNLHFVIANVVALPHQVHAHIQRSRMFSPVREHHYASQEVRIRRARDSSARVFGVA